MQMESSAPTEGTNGGKHVFCVGHVTAFYTVCGYLHTCLRECSLLQAVTDTSTILSCTPLSGHMAKHSALRRSVVHPRTHTG